KEQLKQICRDYKIRGFSKYNVVELIDFVHNSLTEEQLEKVFEIPESLIYTKEINSDSNRELDKLYKIIKNIYPKLGAVNIEKKDFEQIDVKGHIQGKRLDFTVSFERFSNFGTINQIKFEKDIDFISILRVNQESTILHQIYKIDFGDIPDEWYFIQFLK
ncbi:hypothetical protein LCGC14_2395590, partial [marine sediment metagenome]